MAPRLLDDAEFHATFSDPMRRPPEGEDALDIWPYVETIPFSHIEPFDISGHDVEFVWRSHDGRYDHVLIGTNTKNVFLVVVVDLPSTSVFGHHVLNLNEKFGLPTPDAETN